MIIRRLVTGLLWALGLGLVMVLSVPIVALVASVTLDGFIGALSSSVFQESLWLSLVTSSTSTVIVVVTGTPLAWWFARQSSRLVSLVELLANLPIVLPPAVVGIALLQAYGAHGLFGELAMPLAFSTAAVVMAQVVISAPFYLTVATASFRNVDDEILLVARSLGSTPTDAFLRVGLPLSLPGLVAGAALCWARALGEFGATLLFAGSLSGVTMTMPLAVYSALESDVRVALALALSLGAASLAALALIKLSPRLFGGGR